MRPARSTEIYFPVDGAPPSTKSKHKLDAFFWHDDAQFPGVIIEVAYSQKRKRLDRLAEEYLLDSDASVQVVVILDIGYGKKGSRKATLSVWRTHVVSALPHWNFEEEYQLPSHVRLLTSTIFLTSCIARPRRVTRIKMTGNI